ncbi:type II toxin-antitoxin system ParD family antitoxin [Neptuniibacter sp. PT34_22]|uniref:type II toxin-antitoxin system ParD family antitoxin n=1 Tax=Neptuniibacter sp. PT34_22 TaxID=3398205 RepID=UPI0039F612CF
MNVSLTPKLEAFVKSKVESGSYNSSSEVVREALRLLEQRDAEEQLKLETLRAEIQKGLDSVAAGNVRDGREIFEEIKKRKF